MLLNYWQGACALTGVAVPEVLKAGYTKLPDWALLVEKDDETKLYFVVETKANIKKRYAVV